MSNPLLEFTQALWSNSDIVLTSSDPATDADIALSLEFLRFQEVEYRRGLPGEAPPLNDAAVAWALSRLYRACQFLIYRELPESQLHTDLEQPCPERHSPSACYSVDLVFRFLPAIHRMARAVSEQDPLVDCLLKWGRDWPLSSVGMPKLIIETVDGFIGDGCLRTLYVDRILATRDDSRLSLPDVANAVRTALGDFRELAPGIYDVVQRTGTEDPISG